ncbi:MAG: hypothetical protein JWM39_128 [Parcubacteria group bacterium]|nr:hypothetical protein [Parcubacteria group bacterium]
MSLYRKTSVRLGIAASCLMLVCTLSFAPILPDSVEYAHAQLPVTDVAVLAAISATAVPAGITAGNTTAQTVITKILNGIAWAVAKAVIQAITKSMITWINSGFNGSPSFVTNINQNLLGVSDGVANSFFNAIANNTSGGVKSPFQDVVSQGLRNEYYSSTGRSVTGGYSLNQFSNNPAGFLAGKFASNGGFNAWFAAVGNNQNNPYGAAYSQQQALNATVYAATTNRLNELNWGKGFMSWRGSCTSTASKTSSGIGPVTTKITDPSALNGPLSVPTNADGSVDYSGGSLSNVDTSSLTSLSSADNCTSNSIRTPGTVIENTLGITATSPLRQLELANSINEIVGALASQLVTQVVGAVGLSGVSQPSAGGGLSPLAQATNPSQYAQPGLAAGFVQSVTNDIGTAQAYLANWQKLQSIARSCISSDPKVAAALTLSNTNIARGNAAVSALTTISTAANAAAASTDPSVLAAVSTQYQNLIATTTGGYIQTTDSIDAQIQSNPAVGSTTSLYTTLSGLCSTSI